MATFFASLPSPYSYSNGVRGEVQEDQASTASDDEKEKAAKEKFFLENIRPVLFETCLKCHGPEKTENGLRVDTRTALIEGGETGEAIVPERPEASLLLKALKYTDQDLQMPPDIKLEDKVAEAFEKWIKEGAVWAEPAKVPK
jgi:Planctomycete cytochrome C